VKLLTIVPLAALVSCACFPARAADLKLPNNQEIQGIRNLCAGGDVQSIDARLEAALKAWKASPGVKVDFATAKKDLGAVIEKVNAEAGGNALYEKYLSCVRDLVNNYLSRMNPAVAASSATP
jgi:hypothetical protein